MGSIVAGAAAVSGVAVCRGKNDEALNALAKEGAESQAARGQCGHFIRHNRAEVAAMMGGADAGESENLWAAAFQMWMGSPGHRAIVTRSYSRWGAAKTYRNGRWYFTLVCE